MNSLSFPFFGVNGHPGWKTPIYQDSALQINKMAEFGSPLAYRAGYTANMFKRFQEVADLGAPKGITLLPCLLCDIGTTESASYNNGLSIGMEAAKNLKGRVKVYQVGNEEGTRCLTGNVDGTIPKHFDNAKFCQSRGKILGMIAGIRAEDPNAFIVLGADTWLHFGFTDMLMTGTQPDGTANHTKPLVNGLAWHWYSDMNDIEAAQGGTGKYNVLARLATYKLPIFLTEIGARSYNFKDEISVIDYFQKVLQKYLTVKNNYNLVNVCIYELEDDGRTDGQAGSEGKYGLTNYDGSNKARFSALQSWIKAHKV